MRTIVLAAAILTSVPTAASAVQIATDVTEVLANRPDYSTGPAPATIVVPARPSFFVHVGKGPVGPSGMPHFTTADGTPIRIARVVPIQEGGWNFQRVDLDIDYGEIVVAFDGRNYDDHQAYSIDPAFVPRTRSVELLSAGMTLWVDSDAVAFRIDGQPFSWQQFNDGTVEVDPFKKQRVIALYANGVEEVIYDGVPVSRDELARKLGVVPHTPTRSPDDVPFEALILLFLGLVAFAFYATPRVD